MQKLPNRVSLNYEDNPDLKDALAGKKVGDPCKLTLDVTLDDIGEGGITASVNAAVPEGYAKDDEEKKPTVEIEAEVTPVDVVISGKKAKGKTA
jgi:hypothetical protein